jgi:hypothetical protein
VSKVGITTTIRVTDEIMEKAMNISRSLDTDYYPRNKMGIAKLLRRYDLDYVLIVESDRLTLRGSEDGFYWHPNTAKLKLRALKRGEIIPMIRAMGISEGDSLLDCTLGIAGDSIVASSVLGDKGKIVGLEADKYLSFLTREGLKNYSEVDAETKGYMERIEVVNERYENYLKDLDDNSFDVVYMDPMFVNPNEKSSAISSLSTFADHSPLTMESLDEAKRVARKRVVVKLRYGSEDFVRLDLEEYIGKSRLGALVFGVFRCNKNS